MRYELFTSEDFKKLPHLPEPERAPWLHDLAIEHPVIIVSTSERLADLGMHISLVVGYGPANRAVGIDIQAMVTLHNGVAYVHTQRRPVPLALRDHERLLSMATTVPRELAALVTMAWMSRVLQDQNI
ncbi:MAG TPA: hypothetical protein VI322_03625 [Candidatus Saccharimonadia bacterium]